MSCVHASLLQSVERHLCLTGTSASGFGRKIAGDPRLVFDMRKGRRPKAEMQERLKEAVAREQVLYGEAQRVEQGPTITLDGCL